MKNPHPADTEAADPCATKSCMTGILGDVTHFLDLAKTRSPGSLSPTLRVHIFTLGQGFRDFHQQQARCRFTPGIQQMHEAEALL